MFEYLSIIYNVKGLKLLNKLYGENRVNKLFVNISKRGLHMICNIM